MTLHDCDVLFFDFDGVIIDSLPVREKGFREILRDYAKDHVDQLIAYHDHNGGLSRFVKIRYFYEKILGESIQDERVQQLAQEFSDIMRRELTNKDYLIAETVAFIKQNASKPLYIVSGSEQNELRFLCEQLGVEQYFQGIYGSPTPKIDLVRTILEENAYTPERCILIGDSINDYDAAIQNKLIFYGYNNCSLKNTAQANYIEAFADI